MQFTFLTSIISYDIYFKLVSKSHHKGAIIMIEIQEPHNSFKEFPGPVLILSGPGTGKTYQLGLRVKFLIEKLKANPNEITIITFTKEAARNMREKLSNEEINIPKEKHPEIISTMHSLGNSIIRSKPEKFEIDNNFEILHEDFPRKVLLKDAANIASFRRSKWWDVSECRKKGNCVEDIKEEKCKICKEYKRILRKCSYIDYDDQIMLACEILKEDGEVSSDWRSKTRYLLVDEYQDINQAQCELIQLLTRNQTDGLFAVGDDDQSIYSFRGGNPKYICEFEKYYGKNYKLGRLSKSWRCSEHILKGARTIIKCFYKKSVPKPKPTFSEDMKTNNKIFFYNMPSEKEEAKKIAALAKNKIKTGDIKILIPNKNYLPPLKKALINAGLDFQYKLKIKDDGLMRFTVLSSWVEEPNNSIKLRHLIDLIINNNDELIKIIETEENKLTLKREKASELLSDLWQEVNNDNSLYKVISCKLEKEKDNQFLLNLKEILDELLRLLKEEGSHRYALPKFLQQCGLCIAPGKNPNELINEVKDLKEELIRIKRESSYPPINIYNLPSSKGLQADLVFVVGLSKSLFPDPKKDLEEQSRLFFVAMTRAEQELYLFHTRIRSGEITFKKDSYQLKKSTFIDAIPNELIEETYIPSRRK